MNDSEMFLKALAAFFFTAGILVFAMAVIKSMGKDNELQNFYEKIKKQLFPAALVLTAALVYVLIKNDVSLYLAALPAYLTLLEGIEYFKNLRNQSCDEGVK